MTDNEIIKVLECCWKNYKEDTCKYCVGGCPASSCDLTEDEDDCMDVLYRRTINLINRQKAKIERLQKYHDDMESAIYSFKEDWAKVKFLKKQIKSEAIKEFAERVVALIYEAGDVNPLSESQIDNLVKEMTDGCE